MTSMQGKVIAITGAASGIGLATAKLLASRGAILSLADINEESLNDTLQSLRSGEDKDSKHLATVVDVRSSSSINDWIEKTVQKLGKLDGAANIAGVASRGKLLRDAPDEDWDFIMNVNGRGVWYCMRAELNNINHGGSIVNAASVAGIRGLTNTSIYCASKHAVIGMTKSAARENGDRNIRINAVAPGMIDTPMTRGLGLTDQMFERLTGAQALKRVADPVEIASVIAFLLSDEASFVTGACWSADAGWQS